MHFDDEHFISDVVMLAFYYFARPGRDAGYIDYI